MDTQVRRARRARSVALCALLSAVALLPGTAGTVAAGTLPGSCPSTVAAADLVIGSVGRGWTVPVGTTPQPFRAEILGVIHDGVSVGRDLIVADLSDVPGSQMIARNGVWAGMSGSPVYVDARLIGAVAYGFQTDGTIAGITPIADMRALLAQPVTAAAPADRDRVTIPLGLRSTIAARSGVTPAASASTLDRLPLPLAVSGGSARVRARIQAKYDELGVPVIVTAGSSAAAPAGGTLFGTARPGANFAAMLSYGDVAAGAIGTTTYVCNGMALAFGHPLLYSGRSSLGANDALALTVVHDILGSYKLANVTSPLGLVDRDRLAGLRTQLGVAPRTIPVTSTVTKPGGVSRDGETDVTSSAFLPFYAAMHLLVNLDAVLDRTGKGSAAIGWTVNGHRADGTPFTLHHGDRYASQDDIASASVNELYDQLGILYTNPYEAITFDSVHVNGALSPSYAPYSVAGVAISKNGGAFRVVSSYLRVRGGDTLTVRTTLQRYRSTQTRTVQSSVVVPLDFTDGNLVVGSAVDDFFGPSIGPSTDFDSLLQALREQPRNDDVAVRVVTFGPTGPVTAAQSTVRLDAVVHGSVELGLLVQP